MDFGEAILSWNGLVSNIKNSRKLKEDFNSVLSPVLISGAIAGFFFGMGYGFFYFDLSYTIFLSLLGIFLGPPAFFVFLLITSSFYLLTSAVFGARKTKARTFFGPQSLVHSLFAIIFGVIYAFSGLLYVINSFASLIFFSTACLLFTLYYLYVMPYVLHFQTGLSRLRSFDISLVIPLASIILYVLSRSIVFLVSMD